LEKFKMANTSSPVSFIGGAERTVTITNTTDTQAAAIANQTLTGGLNIVTVLAANGMCALPVLPAGSIVLLTSTVATQTLKVYPPVGGIISGTNSAGTLNAAVTLAAQGGAMFLALGTNNGCDFHRVTVA
jgi:hypothetical protein